MCSLIRDFEEDNLNTYIGQAAEFRFDSRLGHLAITPKGSCRRQSKVLTAKSIAKLLEPRSGTAWAGRAGKHEHKGGSESAAVAAGRDRFALGRFRLKF